MCIQWLFNGHPELLIIKSRPLQMGNLVGVGAFFKRCHANIQCVKMFKKAENAGRGVLRHAHFRCAFNGHSIHIDPNGHLVEMHIS